MMLCLLQMSFLTVRYLQVLGSDELLRLYDNVPKLAKAQTIQGNRLMYGNYVDQYDVTKEERRGYYKYGLHS